MTGTLTALNEDEMLAIDGGDGWKSALAVGIAGASITFRVTKNPYAAAAGFVVGGAIGYFGG